MSSPEALAKAITRHAVHDGTFKTRIPGVTLIRASSPTVPMPVIYEPTVCFVAQGRKRAMLGPTAFDYNPARHLIASVGLPVVGSVTQASEQEPYLSLQLDLDMRQLGELEVRYPSSAPDPQHYPTALTLNDTTPALLDAATRLVSLLDSPDDIGEVAPLTLHEILYRLLMGSGGNVIRQMFKADSRLSQIARAIVWIRQNFRLAYRVEEVADVAAMSKSTFHQHFKAITSMSPLEFRTQLRLQEARRLMISNAMNAATAAFNVGYESPSQFSRDYSRIFGKPPAADTSSLRAAQN